MPHPAPDPSAQRFRLLRELFERASSLPSTEREAFVRLQAGDAAMADEVLSLLRGTKAQITAWLAAGVARGTQAAPADAVPRGAGERVQSTATDALLAKLATAPKLDEARYQLEGEIGRGGMGLVLRYRDQHLNRALAMKVLIERRAPETDEERRLIHQLLGRFLEEAQVTSQLDHPGIVPVHELGLDNAGKVYFTMRLVKGRTASEVFAEAHAETNDWTTTRALEVILKVCDTMAYAHDKGVLHRDLKPSNVMVGRFGEVYVMDWGLAKVLGQADRHDLRIRKDASTGVSRLDTARKRDAEGDTGSSVVTVDGAQLGTPSYMPPEQARSEELDQRADVYAIGAMMYELLTGRAPYTVPGARQPAYRILNDVLDGPPKRIEDVQKGVPAELVAIVERAMARQREQRYGNVLELAADVRAYLAQRVVKAYRTGAIVEMQLWMRRNRALASSLAAALLISVVATLGMTALWAEANDRATAERTAKVEADTAKIAAQASEGRAKEQEQLAKQQEQLATTRAQQLEVENEKNSVFADAAQLVIAKSKERGLYPPFPDKVVAMDEWLRDYGEPLAALLPSLQQRLASLQARAKASTPEQREAARKSHPRLPELAQRRNQFQREDDLKVRLTFGEQIRILENEIAVAGWDFTDATDDYVHRVLVRLVGELTDFVARELPEVKTRRAEAASVQLRTLDGSDVKAKWGEAIAAIAASDDVRASELYRKFPLTPQMGLVPLGMDPVSKLWEFVHLASGTPGKAMPERDATTQRLIPTGDMGIVFVLIPGGTLPPGTVDMNNDMNNKDKASVRLGVQLDAFFLAKYEMTQGQWLRLTGSNPSNSKTSNNRALPVETVDWFDSEEVLRHQGLVLPSDLRWEYACRAGTATLWWTGDDESGVKAAENLGDDGLPVGSKEPNRFGLFDMSGNVWEWCLDEYSGYGGERDGDGLRPESEGGASIHCIRGGGVDGDRRNGLSGYRASFYPSFRGGLLGLRPARTFRP